VLFDFQGAAAPTPVNYNAAPGALASAPVAAFTALARHHSNSTSNTLTIKLFDQSGNLAAQDTVTLGPFAQTAFDLTNDAAFHNILRNTNEFDGTLEVTTSGPTMPVASLVVGANLNQLFSLPVTPGVAK
jgi:hypothetical protein